MNNKKAFTLVEMCVVVCISSMLATMLFVLLSRSTKHFRKSNELINVQSSMSTLVENIRNDIKGLKELLSVGENGQSIKFSIIKIGTKEPNTKKSIKSEISYEFGDHTLKRIEVPELSSEGNRTTTLGSKNQVQNISFKPINISGEELDSSSYRDFHAMQMVIQLNNKDMGHNSNRDKDTTLSAIYRFYSNCINKEEIDSEN